MKLIRVSIITLFVFFNLISYASTPSICLQSYQTQVFDRAQEKIDSLSNTLNYSELKRSEPEIFQFPKLALAKLTHKDRLSFEELNAVRNELIQYFKSLGPNKRIVIFTGATSLDPNFQPQSRWNLNRPIKKQTSGVITVMEVMAKDIKSLTGVDVRFVTPEEFGIHYQMKYQDIIAVMAKNKELKKILSEKDNIAFHIMVEDQLGTAAKKFLDKRGIPYTSAYHTDFPQMAVGFSEFYLPPIVHNALMGGPKRKAFIEKTLYKVLRNFHKGSQGI
ncbi:MAG: hypothetical protein KDD45_06235, partial [Bdellovibrionales bacterium]|nr:hypothetical protein [Bdellovibrionales bacterium]